MAYVTIDGVKYEKELLDLAIQHTTGKNEGQISQDEARALMQSAKDGVQVTATELATLRYIRTQYPFTDAAATWFDAELRALADA